MDLLTLLFVTAAVLGVLLVVLAIIAVVVLLPPVRRSLAERRRTADESELETPSTDVDGAVTDSEPANGD